jgi:hypothetical protein
LGQIKGGLFERFIYKKVYILVFTLNEGKSPLIYFYWSKWWKTQIK